MGLTLTCVPLLLHARQCRYYVLVPLFSLLIIDAYLERLQESRLKHWLLFVVWATALVNTFFPGAFFSAWRSAIDLIRRRPGAQFWKRLAIAARCLLI